MKKVVLFLMCAAVLCGCGGSKPQMQEESKDLPVSSLVLQGKHAKLFRPVGESSQVKLVKTDEGWEVRAKVTFERKNSYEQLENNSNYQKELTSIHGNFLNDNDVEVTDCEIDEAPLNMLLQDAETTQATLKPQTWSYRHLSYEEAKAMFDKVACLELTDIVLEEAEEAEVNDLSADDLFDEDTKKTLETATDLLKAEGELLNALF